VLPNPSDDGIGFYSVHNLEFSHCKCFHVISKVNVFVWLVIGYFLEMFNISRSLIVQCNLHISCNKTNTWLLVYWLVLFLLDVFAVQILRFFML